MSMTRHSPWTLDVRMVIYFGTLNVALLHPRVIRWAADQPGIFVVLALLAFLGTIWRETWGARHRDPGVGEHPEGERTDNTSPPAEGESGTRPKTRRRPVVLVVLLIVGICLLVWQLCCRVPPGRILFPADGQQVPTTFTVSGTLSWVPLGKRVRVAIQDGNLLWPQGSELTSAESGWQRQVYAGGNPPGGRFSIVLVMVGGQGNRVIEDWFAEGPRQGWPGLPDLPGAVQLDMAQDLMLERSARRSQSIAVQSRQVASEEHPTVPQIGAITSPGSGQHVGHVFTAQGTLRQLPAGHHVWLAVEVGDLLWPKEPEIPTTSGNWTRQVGEYGNPPGGRFSLVLLMVGPEGNREIQAWLRHGKETGDFPGLTRITDSVRLDVVEGLVLESP